MSSQFVDGEYVAGEDCMKTFFGNGEAEQQDFRNQCLNAELAKLKLAEGLRAGC